MMLAMTQREPVVIRISPMAHFASAFLAVALLVLVPAWGMGSLALMILPVLLSVAIERLRTTADADAVTARGLTSSRALAWAEIEGLRFSRGGWARACRRRGDDVTLPAVTFSTLPQLTAASAGRVPNPYRVRSGEGVGAVQEEPCGDASGDGQEKREE